MKQRVNNNFFINDLAGFEMSMPLRSQLRTVPAVVTAAIAGREMPNLLASYILLGERAQGARDGETLMAAGRSILELPLGSDAFSTGNYYIALALNRQGPQAYPQANKMLLEIAQQTQGIFRSKALLAFGTNCNISGDWPTALEAFEEAARVGMDLGRPFLHPMCCIQIQLARRRSEDGDYHTALEMLRRLSPHVHSLDRQYLPLVYAYYNNITDAMVNEGLFREAQPLSRLLLSSPLYKVHPEWQKTCAEVENGLRTKTAPGPISFPVGRRSAERVSGPNIVYMPCDRALRNEYFHCEPNAHLRASVLSMEAWKKKKKAAAAPAPKIKLNAAQIPLLTTQQKQAAILRFILSDDITDPALDRVIHAMIAHPPRSEDEPSA